MNPNRNVDRTKQKFDIDSSVSEDEDIEVLQQQKGTNIKN